MQESFPSTKDLLKRLVPRVKPLWMIAVSEKFVFVSIFFMFVSLVLAGIGWACPAFKKALISPVMVLYFIGVGFFVFVLLLNIVAVFLIVFQFNFFASELFDQKIECERKVSAELSRSFSSNILVEFVDRLAFEIEQNNKIFSKYVAAFVGLGGLVVGLAPSLANNVWKIKEAIEIVIPSVVVVVILNLFLQKKFSSELARLKYVAVAAIKLQKNEK